jgi:nucleoside-diphosphate-sugar epimerase
MKTIGIIGGSGYIGQHLLKALCLKYAVVSLQRNTQVIMPFIKGIKTMQIAANNQTFDIIINTSYNLDKDIRKVFQQNEEVLSVIKKASHPHTRVIHLSSLAVFGFGLDKPIHLTPISLTPDYG